MLQKLCVLSKVCRPLRGRVSCKAMRPKTLLILSLFMMLTPSFLYWFGPLRRPAMVDGDKLAMLACPVCGGSGQVDGGQCRRCRGKKLVQHVIPSPQRPTYVEGHVYAPDSSSPVPQAKVTLNSSEGSWTVHTDEQGRFGADLPPGSYPLTIEGPGGSLSTDLVVEPQVTPSPVDLDPRFPTRRDEFHLHK